MFFCEFAKHLRAPFLQNTFGRLILFVGYCVNEQLIEPRAFNIKRPWLNIILHFVEIKDVWIRRYNWIFHFDIYSPSDSKSRKTWAHSYFYEISR